MSIIDEEGFAQRQAPLRALLGHPEHFVADLHTHTTLSDGSDDFETLLGRARIRGVTHIAVTNHDTVSGLDRMARLAAERSFPFVGGVEISAWDEQRRSRVHILGLGLSSASAAIERLCAPLLARRSAASAWQAERLRAAGYRIDEDKLARLASASTGLYKQHLMAALTDDSFTSLTYQSLYRTLFKDGGICEREIVYVDARDAVEAVVSDGGARGACPSGPVRQLRFHRRPCRGGAFRHREVPSRPRWPPSRSGRRGCRAARPVHHGGLGLPRGVREGGPSRPVRAHRLRSSAQGYTGGS